MNTGRFTGCGTALVTPFTEGEVDYAAYAALIDRQVDAGVDFLVALATTGETPTLTAEEKVALLKLTYGHAGGLPVLAGCGSNSLSGTLANMALLDGPEVAGWLVVVPFYNKPTQEGIFLYFKAVAESTDKPVILYNVPGRTGVNMTAATCLRLAREVPNIVAVKEASGKIDQIEEIINCAPEGFSVLSGDDAMTFPAMKAGAKGVISVASNLVPDMVRSLTDAALQGDFEKAEDLHKKLLPLFGACFIESNPIPVKAGMAELGLMGAEMRLPLTEALPGTRAKMAELLSQL